MDIEGTLILIGSLAFWAIVSLIVMPKFKLSEKTIRNSHCDHASGCEACGKKDSSCPSASPSCTLPGQTLPRKTVGLHVPKG